MAEQYVPVGGLHQDKKEPDFLEQVAEVIEKKHNWRENDYLDIDQAAAEIDLLYNQPDKTLTKLAANYGIPLWQAMECARIGERAAMAEVNQEGEEYVKNLKKEKEELERALNMGNRNAENSLFVLEGELKAIKKLLQRLK